MVVRTRVHEKAPLNSQWPACLKMVVPISTIVGLLILSSKNVLGL